MSITVIADTVSLSNEVLDPFRISFGISPGAEKSGPCIGRGQALENPIGHSRVRPIIEAEIKLAGIGPDPPNPSRIDTLNATWNMEGIGTQDDTVSELSFAFPVSVFGLLEGFFLFFFAQALRYIP